MNRTSRHRGGNGRIRAVLSVLLAVLTILSMLPVDAFAAEAGTESGDTDAAAKIEQADEALVEDDRITVPVRNKARQAAQDTAQDMVECTWFFDNDDIEITWDDDVAQWHMEKTSMRYVEMAIRVNIGTNVATGTGGEDLAAGAVKVTLPYYLPTGRVTDGKQVKAAPWTSPVGDDASGLSISVDKDSNEVVVTNRVSIAAGTHKSVVIFYKADCWNIVNGESFDVEYTWESVNGTNGDGELKGCVFTGFDIASIDLRNKTVNNSTFFSSTAGTSKYLYTYASDANRAFGLTQEEYDRTTGGNYALDPDYVYDVMSIHIYPKGNQPYDIKGTFVPGQYPSTSGDRRAYGWEGELVGVCVATSLNGVYYYWRQVDFTEHKGISYDDLPNKSTENTQYVEESKQYKWNAYDFSIDSNKLSIIISTFSDSMPAKTHYCLSFLVKYPRKDFDNDGVISISHDQSSRFLLHGTASVSHLGLDSDEPVTKFVSGLLYSGGIYKRPTYPDYGSIYSDSTRVYDSSYKEWATYCMADCKLDDFLMGDKAVSVSQYAAYRCYNERRASIPFDTGEYYTLEGIIDVPYMFDYRYNPDGDTEDYYRLKKGDYKILSFYLNGMYDVHREYDIYTGEESYPDMSFPEWAENEKIYVYGSTETDGDDSWEQLASFDLADVWRKKSAVITIPDGKDILRLKAVYPSSRLTTYFQIYYTWEVYSTDSLIARIQEYIAKRPSLTEISIYGNIDYKAYLKKDYDQFYPNGPITPDLSTDRAYASVRFSYMGNYNDYTGIAVGQTLYDSQGKVVAETQCSTGNNMDFTATNVSKIRYRVSNFCMKAMDMSSYLSPIRSGYSWFRDQYVEKNIDSPYVSNTSRYYILVPRGMRYLENSISRIKGTTPIVISSEWLNDRQLLIIDTKAGEYIKANGIKPGNLNGYVENTNHAHTDAGWGSSIQFDVVPREDGAIIQSGNYEAQFMHQYLTDNEDRAFSLKDCEGIVFTSASEAYKGSEARMIDTYIKSLGEPNLTATSLAFRNRTGSEGSYAMVQVKDGDISHNNGEYGLSALTDLTTEDADSYYSYSLTYTVDSGNSKDVVLWDNIEVYDRGGNAPDWTGTPAGVDTNDTGAVAYVNTESISIDDYVNAGADCTWLTDGAHGWAEADESTDWSAVRSVAFWFKDKTFDSKEKLGPKTATVYLKMLAPDKIRTNADQNTYLTYNEIGFTDWHSTLQATATVLSNSVDVGVYIENPEPEAGGFELPRTGGMGTDVFVMTGVPMMLGAGLLLAARRRRRQ